MSGERAKASRLRPAARKWAAAALLAGGAAVVTPASDAEVAIPVERLLQELPSAERLDRHLRHLTAEPHPAGSPRNMELADYIRDRFRDYGLKDVHFHDTPALYSYGRSASVRILAPVDLELDLTEDAYPEDEQSDLYQDPSVVAYHEYAASGEVTAEVVYANSGSPEDFAWLEEQGIRVAGKIVLMRYSVPYSYRGYKVWMAESRGALGTIIYSDPADDGYRRGEVYPRGPWGPASHIQWGSIVYDWLGFGVTPFTFHWRQQPDGGWTEGPRRDHQLPGIPSLPMSHRSAAEILSRLRGPVAPPEGQGALPFTYRVGPGPVRLRLRVDNQETIGTMRNVIGTIPGTDEPHRWVVVGNHRDAWIYGARDPSAGTAILLEVARTLGEVVRQGRRPRRTIVFANWDAEEDLLGGSTSWVKDHREKLRRDGVVYVNLDGGAAGPDFKGGSTPALAEFLREVTRAIAHPDGDVSVYEAWRAASESEEPEVEIIVGATDYTAFQAHLGMSCVDLAFDGPYGVYHSQYDSYFWMSRIADPGLRYNLTLARLLAVLVWRLADDELLPLRYSHYAEAVLEHLEETERKAQPQRRLQLERARRAAVAWRRVAVEFEEVLAARPDARAEVAPLETDRLNELLLRVERAMTEEAGLESRPFYKHLIYAPQPTYRKQVLPRLFEAIEAGRWDRIEGFEQQLVDAFEQATALLQQAHSAPDAALERGRP